MALHTVRYINKIIFIFYPRYNPALWEKYSIEKKKKVSRKVIPPCSPKSNLRGKKTSPFHFLSVTPTYTQTVTFVKFSAQSFILLFPKYWNYCSRSIPQALLQGLHCEVTVPFDLVDPYK